MCGAEEELGFPFPLPGSGARSWQEAGVGSPLCFPARTGLNPPGISPQKGWKQSPGLADRVGLTPNVREVLLNLSLLWDCGLRDEEPPGQRGWGSAALTNTPCERGAGQGAPAASSGLRGYYSLCLQRAPGRVCY